LDNAAFVSIKVIEFIETAGTSNPNILIGNGNISCGNLSCSTISITNHTIDNLITTQNVNVGGSMVTVGFPESGVIVPSSVVRLAGGSTVQNYADMEWDGTTFNISTRQGTKNFKVSFGQVAHLEVDSTNVSVQSLKVNQTLEVLGTLIYDDLILNDSLLLNGTFSAFGATFRDDVIFERDVDIEQTLNVSNINVSGNVVCGGTITGSNLSTVALIPGSNITIVNNVISAFVESDADIVVSSLHVDNSVNIYGILNVSQTSNFGQSLNVDNQLFVGKSGTTNGDVVLYSTNVGDNFEIQNGVTETSFLGTGNISKFNFSLGGNQTVTISPSQVNISGDLIVNGNISGTLDFQNLSATNLSVVNLTVDLIQGDLNAGDMFASSLTTTGRVETGKWLIGASDSTTASLYNKDITSTTTHYALRQTNGGATSINGTSVYFKNNGTDVGQWTATGLGVGKTTPTSTLDVSGDSFFAGEVDIVGDLTTENISATTLTTTGHVETGKWFLGALNTTTSELYNKDVTSSTTHYALRQTNGGSTSLNGAEIYFKNNSVIIAEINATGLCIGKTTPTAALDVSGNTLITGNVNICGILDADDIVLDNISNTNFSGNQITANQIDVTGHIETGKWLIGASDSTTASLYNKDITSVTTHYALRQTNGGATSLNGTGVYFKNNGTDVGEWTSTGLGIGKTSPTKKLDVSGNSLFTGDINVCGSIYSDNVSSTIVNTPLVTSNILDLDGTDRILFNINNVPHMELIEDELYLYVDCIAQTMDVQQKLDGLNMSMTNISTARLTSTNTSVTNLSATQISSNFVLTPTLLNVSYLWSDGTIDFRTNSLPTLAMNNASAKFFQDVNISGTLRADAIDGIDFLNICSTNISTTNLSADETSSNHINCSTLTVLDTGGAGGLDVTGTSYFRSSFFSYGDAYLESNDNYFGDPAGTELRSRINFWGQKTAGEVAVRFGCDTDDIVRLKLERFGLYTQYNINISNVSTMDMDNTSTKFHQNVNVSASINATFLDVINASVSNDLDVDGVLDCFDLISDTGTITTFDSTTINVSTINASIVNGANLSTASFLLGTGLTFALNTLSADFTSVETTIASEIATEVDTTLLNTLTANIGFLKVDGIANMSYLNASNVCFTNLSATNLSATNLSATSITAPNVQPTLIAGNNITIVGTTISATGGTPDLTNISNTNFSGVNISATDQTLSNKLVVSNTTASTIQATIGFLDIDTRFANSVQLGHKNFTGTNDYCLSISATGSTYFNCPSTANVHFANGGTECFRIASGSNLSMASGKSILASKTSSTNISNTNLSSVNITATSITAANVQPIITDGSLTIARTSGLQTALDSKEPTITSSTDLTINTLTTSSALIDERVTGAMYLSQKDKNTQYNYALKQTSGGAVSLNTGANTNLDLNVNNVNIATINSAGFNVSVSNMSQLNISNISAINLSATSITAPNVQPIIADGDLTIARTSGLQTALDSKQSTITSSTDLTMDTLTATSVKHKSDFASFRSNNFVFTSSYTFLNIRYQNNILNNSLLTAGGTSQDTFTITKAGYYYITSNTPVVQNNYNNRVCWRIRHLVNGAFDYKYGETFTYTRHDDYGEFGGMTLTSLILLAVGDTFNVRIELKKANGNIGNEMSGTIALGGTITFQYLGN
jgi:hypothetical protein